MWTRWVLPWGIELRTLFKVTEEFNMFFISTYDPIAGGSGNVDQGNTQVGMGMGSWL